MRPSPSELRAMLELLSPERIAIVYQTTPERVRSWVRDLDNLRTREGIEDIRTRLMRRVLGIAEDDSIVLPRDRIAQAKLCMGVIELMSMMLDDIPATIRLDRSELLAKVRKAREEPKRASDEHASAERKQREG